jgi:CDP-diacylglycerol--glycerol-3-phosphate 3-phosphatidyltransferase
LGFALFETCNLRPETCNLRAATMNLPNKLTVSRFALTVLFLWAIFSRSHINDTLALALFCAAALTDILDGRTARKRRVVTNFGILMDPLADKILTCSAFIVLVERHMATPPAALFQIGSFLVRPKVEAWMVVIIVARELAITGLRLLAASKNVVLAAERYGKHKTASQMAAIIVLLVMDASGEWWPWLKARLQVWLPWLALAALWLTVVLTFVSGAIYLWRNRSLYLSDV